MIKPVYLVATAWLSLFVVVGVLDKQPIEFDGETKSWLEVGLMRSVD